MAPALGAKEVDDKLGQLGDWIRVSYTNWFLWSDKTQGDIATALGPLRKSIDDQFIVFVVQAEAAHGFSAPWIWSWLNDKMQRQFQGLP